MRLHTHFLNLLYSVITKCSVTNLFILRNTNDSYVRFLSFIIKARYQNNENRMKMKKKKKKDNDNLNNVKNTPLSVFYINQFNLRFLF